MKGFAPWKPQKRTEPLVRDMEGVIAEYCRYLPLTVRQVFYRLKGLPQDRALLRERAAQVQPRP